MKTRRLSRREFLHLAGASIGGALLSPVLPIALPGPTPLAPQASIALSGWVKDPLGNPVPSGIRVIDEEWIELGTAQTTSEGYYELTVPGSDKLSVSVNPSVGGSPQHYIDIEGGFRASRHFGLTKTIIPAGDIIEIDFTLPPATVVWLEVYNSAGAQLLMGDITPQVSPPWYGPIYGVFPADSFDLPVPTGPSIGQLTGAWHPVIVPDEWEPYFAVPPDETVYLMMLWPVPNIGTIPLRADNRGLGYRLNEGEVLPINIVYEFAETEYRRSIEKKSTYEGQGYLFTSEVTDWLSQASDHLVEARSQADGMNRALLSYTVLELSIKAREQMALEVAERGIEDRQQDMAVVVVDEGGNPISGANVTYQQIHQDFVLGYGTGLPWYPFPDPTLKAGKEIGFEYIYDMGEARWSKISSGDGIYNFTNYNSALTRTRNTGYGVVVILAWLGPDNVPAWAANLGFSEFKQNVCEYVKETVRNLKGKVNYINLAVEPSLLTVSGSRYVDVEFESSYVDGMKVDELIDLVKAVFLAAQEENTGIQLGYSVAPSYNYWQLNPLAFGGRPPPYSLLKQTMESGVQPDFIGVELQHGTIQVPIDLSTLSETIQAYHDLTGLPILLTEMSSYPSRAEDYGLTAPAPNVYWHAGMTQQAQAEWDTSVFKIAMGLPYGIGVQMVHISPDNPEWGQSLYGGTFIGTDYLDQNREPKQVYDAMQGLFGSWTAQGSAVTGTDGRASFKGLAGDYSVVASTEDGLQQSFEFHFGSESGLATGTFDRTKAVGELRYLMVDAQMKIELFERAGRDLDYSDLRLKLEDARNAFAAGEYAGARNLTSQILDAVRMNIDGSAVDWEGIQPIATAPSGGIAVNAPGTDLKALYAICDHTDLYLMVEVYDPPFLLQPGTSPGFPYPQFLFDLKTGSGDDYHLRAYLPYHGQMDVYNLQTGQILSTLYSVAHAQVLELKVPLALLDSPGSLSVHAFVMAQNNGQEQVIKGFQGDAQVICPRYDVCLPLILRNP